MQNLQKISRCLISVSNKDGIVELARFLQDRNVEIISTGGTKKLLLDNKILRQFRHLKPQFRQKHFFHRILAHFYKIAANYRQKQLRKDLCVLR